MSPENSLLMLHISYRTSFKHIQKPHISYIKLYQLYLFCFHVYFRNHLSLLSLYI